MATMSHHGRATAPFTLAEIAALRIVGADKYDAGRFASSLGSAGTFDIGDLLSREETLQLLTPGGGIVAATASFPGRIDVDTTPGRIPVAGDASIRMPRLLDFTRITPTDSSLIRYSRETQRDDVAEETALGDLAPAATEVFEPVEANVREVTAAITAFRSQFADLPEIETLLETRLGSTVRGRLERQLVQGDGVGENLLGILATPGIGTVHRDLTNSELRYDAVRRGITAVRTNLHDEPNCIAMHPADWDVILNERDGDNHLVVSGEERVARKIESVPVVPSTGVPTGTPLVGAFDLGCSIRLRAGLTAQISDSHSDYWTKRLVAILVFLRAAVTVPTPLAFCEVIF